jgi:hypothetical protein
MGKNKNRKNGETIKSFKKINSKKKPKIKSKMEGNN